MGCRLPTAVVRHPHDTTSSAKPKRAAGSYRRGDAPGRQTTAPRRQITAVYAKAWEGTQVARRPACRRASTRDRRRAASAHGRRAGRQRRGLQRLAVGHRFAIGGHVDRDVTLDVELGIPHVDPVRSRCELDRARCLVARAAPIGRVIGPRCEVDPDPADSRTVLIAALSRRCHRAPAAAMFNAGVGLTASGPPDGRLSAVREACT